MALIVNFEKVSWVAAELGMSGDGNDEEIVKLSIEGKVMMITIITMMMMMIMMMTSIFMMAMMMVMMPGARDP